MKRCPQCKNVPTDETHSFCRTDGVRLVQHNGSFTNTETIQLPSDWHQAASSATVETPDWPAATTTALNPANASTRAKNLLRIKKRAISIVAILAMVAVT